jgi:hypothetical protein
MKIFINRLTITKLIKILLSFLLLFTISGCINYHQETQIYPDGSGEMKIHYWMSVPDSQSLKVLDNIGIFREDSIRSEFDSPFIHITNIRVYADSTDSTSHTELEFKFPHIDSLNQTAAFADANFSFLDGAAGQKIFSHFIPPIATGFGVDASAFQVRYVYRFSGEIITHNATAIEGGSLVWQYNLAEIGKGKTISVTFRPYKIKETPVWIYALAGFVMLVVLVFLFRKKKD